MLFHSIVGKDEQELQSPSWFNIQEAKLVVKYVQVRAGRCVVLLEGSLLQVDTFTTNVDTFTAVMHAAQLTHCQ
jgi:hypothetical protein